MHNSLLDVRMQLSSMHARVDSPIQCVEDENRKGLGYEVRGSNKTGEQLKGPRLVSKQMGRFAPLGFRLWGKIEIRLGLEPSSCGEL